MFNVYCSRWKGCVDPNGHSSSQKHRRRFQTTVYGKYWSHEIFKFLLHVTVALDQRKQKYTEVLKILF